MTKIALISLGEQETRVALRVQTALPGSRLYVHEKVQAAPHATRFARIIDLTRQLFSKYQGLVYFAPCGVVVRAIAPNVQSKLSDPAVVVVDAGARYAVSLLSGHEGGANELAMRISSIIDADPVVSTTTEAEKCHTMGIGCRRGVSAAQIRQAIEAGCAKADIAPSQVRVLASADLKAAERGLLQAAGELQIPLRFFSSQSIRTCAQPFTRSRFVQSKVNLPAVAEPCALLAGRRTSLVLNKTIFGPVTIAIAKENCLWWESAPAEKTTAPVAVKKRSRKRRSSPATPPTSS